MRAGRASGTSPRTVVARTRLAAGRLRRGGARWRRPGLDRPELQEIDLLADRRRRMRSVQPQCTQSENWLLRIRRESNRVRPPVVNRAARTDWRRIVAPPLH